MTYSNLQKLVDQRISLALRAYDNPKYGDRGLLTNMMLTDAIMRAVKWGYKIEEIEKIFSQAECGKGFHITTSFDEIFVTREAIEISWEHEKFPDGQKIACWEHVIPWKYNIRRIANYIRNSEFIDERKILEMVVEGSVKCFISGAEDKKLVNAKLNSKMPQSYDGTNTFARYDEVGIKPLVLSYHEYGATHMKKVMNKLKKFTKADSTEEYISELTV